MTFLKIMESAVLPRVVSDLTGTIDMHYQRHWTSPETCGLR